MVTTCYQISWGTIIRKRKEWGNKYIQSLAEDLKEYGKGYSFPRLMKMSQFANLFTYKEIISQPVRENPWGTIIDERNQITIYIS